MRARVQRAARQRRAARGAITHTITLLPTGVFFFGRNVFAFLLCRRVACVERSVVSVLLCTHALVLSAPLHSGTNLPRPKRLILAP